MDGNMLYDILADAELLVHELADECRKQIWRCPQTSPNRSAYITQWLTTEAIDNLLHKALNSVVDNIGMDGSLRFEP